MEEWHEIQVVTSRNLQDKADGSKFPENYLIVPQTETNAVLCRWIWSLIIVTQDASWLSFMQLHRARSTGCGQGRGWDGLGESFAITITLSSPNLCYAACCMKTTWPIGQCHPQNLQVVVSIPQKSILCFTIQSMGHSSKHPVLVCSMP